MQFYPSSSRVEEIKAELFQLESDVFQRSKDVAVFLRNFSNVVRFAAKSSVISSYVLREWIWIGSQFRIYEGKDEEVVKVSGRLILFVVKQFERLRHDVEGAQTDVRWATSYTVSILLDELGADGFRVFLSREERQKAEDQWLALYEEGDTDLQIIEDSVDRYLRAFEHVSSECYLPDMGLRIRGLLDVAKSGVEESKWASAALAYLVTDKDIVPDNLGYFGLVDDIFVLNQAFAMCCRQSPWLFLLDSFVKEWPDLGRIVIREGEELSPLPQYTQAVLGSALYSLIHGPKASCIVIPQVGELALSAGFFAVLQAARANSEPNYLSHGVESGASVILSSTNRHVKAIYQGTVVVDGQTFHLVELAKGARQSLTAEFLDAMHLSPVPHAKLSSSKEFQRWRDDFAPIVLEQLLNAKLRLDDLVPEVMLVTKRKKLEQWLKRFRPLSKKLSELVGVRYFMRTGLWDDVSGTISTKPLLFTCSDTFTAAELLRSAEEKKGAGDLRWVIVDMSAVSGDITELLLALEDCPSCKCVFIAGLEEAELCRELVDSGVAQLYVAPDDVGVLGSRYHATTSAHSTNAYMAQIRCQSIKNTYLVDVKEPKVELLHDLTMAIRSIEDEQESSVFEVLTYSLRQLMRKVIRFYYPVDASESESLSLLLRSSSQLANMVQAYNENIPLIIQALSDLEGFGGSEQSKYRKILEVLREKSAEKTALFCTSQTQKERLESRCKTILGIDSQYLVTIDDLRRSSPYQNLLIPGWFNKKQMRELRASGFAENYYMFLYPFERSWEEVSARAQHRWSGQLIHATSQYAKRFESTYRDFSSVERWPEARPVEEIPIEEEGVSDWSNAQVVAAIDASRAASGVRSEVVKAKMVSFDDPEHFAFLSPNGRAVCIPEVLGGVGGVTEADDVEESNTELNAESVFSRPVKELKVGNLLAFPLDDTGDLLDTLADQILDDSPSIRSAAGSWRAALHEFSREKNLSPVDLQLALEKVGVKRQIATIRHWLFTNETVAPRAWRTELPKIGKLTQSSALLSGFSEVAASIDRIYKARRDAASLLLKQLKSGDVDLERGVLVAEINEHRIEYRVLRISRIDPQADVAADLVGKLHHVANLQQLVA